MFEKLFRSKETIVEGVYVGNVIAFNERVTV